MAPEQPGQAPAVAAAGAAPKPAPPEQLNLAAGTARGQPGDGRRARSPSSSSRESNEPQFEQALADKQAAAAHAADRARASSGSRSSRSSPSTRPTPRRRPRPASPACSRSKGAALAALVAAKGKTKTKDEAKRAEVTTKIQGIFAATEKDVKAILDGLDPKVDTAFTEGEAAARQAFETYVDGKMRAYKKDRYGGWLGGLRWAKDKLLGMPDKVNEFYAAGRELYLKQMDGVISRVADIVAADLTAAKKRIATGRAEIADLRQEPARRTCRRWAREASKEIGERFAQLESDVDAKQEAVVDTLATKYVEARKGLDERIEALQAENKGLVDKAIGAIKAVINTIRELVAMLKDVLSRVAGVVGDIVKAPVKFLGNLIAGVKGGILKFKDNIVDHLRKGLMSWLFGALAEAGVELPDKFDLHGHHQAARLAVRPDLDEHPQPDRQAGRRDGHGRHREGRGDLLGAPHPGRRRAVADAAGQARRHQGDDPRAGQGLRHHEDHHGRDHVADRPAQPRRGLHQGLQDDLRHRDVLRRQRQPDPQVRQHRDRLGRRRRARATSPASSTRSTTCSGRWCRSSSASWPA